MTGAERIPTRQVLLDSVVVLASTLGLFVLLGQDTFYKADGQHLVRRLIDRDAHYAHHKLYMPLLIGFGDLIAPLGLTPYRTATVFSALGSALGTALSFAGFRLLGASRGRAWLAAALVATCPAILLFATVVEFHGPFFAFAGLAFVETALLVRRPGWIGAGFLGLACAFAAGVHASGLLLPVLLLLWFLALRRPRGTPRRDGITATIAVVVHYVVTRFVAAPDKANEFLDKGFGQPQGLVYLPEVAWNEWLWAFCPLSLTMLAGLLRRDLRLQALAVLLALAPYLHGALRLLVANSEFGAYLLPLAIPAAWLTVHALPRPPVVVTLLATAALGVTRVIAHDEARHEYLAYARGHDNATGGAKTFLLLGDPWEFGPCLVYLPETKTYLLNDAANMPEEQLPMLFPLFDKIVREEIAAGRDVYLTQGGERYLADPNASTTGSGPLLLAHIRERYELRNVQSGRFEAFRLLPR